IIRIFNTYGPRMRINDGRVISNFIVQALKGEKLTIYGDGSQTRSFCYVDDLVEGIFRVSTYDKLNGEVINLGNPSEFTILELANIIKDILPQTKGFEFLPPLEDDPRKRRPNISKAKKLLNWEPKVPLKEGLRKTIDYFRKVLGL
ncbi:MAG: NAD-dependent epimerase/dehydratase family protein, partial [candidate division WOR-3 bacterium]